MSNRGKTSQPSSDGLDETPMNHVEGYTSAFQTDLGIMYQGDSEQVLRHYPLTEYAGRIQLILTSPPFPLNKKKSMAT